jgi:hypothetical protein
MSEKVKQHGEMLRFLRRATSQGVWIVMKTASPELVRILCECCHNVLKGNVQLSATQKCRLRRYKDSLRELTQTRLSIKRRKAILQQGGFIGNLLAPIVTVLKGFLGF